MAKNKLFISKNFYEDEESLSLLKKILGLTLINILCQKGSYSAIGTTSISGIGRVVFGFRDSESNKPIYISFLPEGGDNPGGRLYGFNIYEIVTDKSLHTDKENLNFSFNFYLDSKLEKIELYGELKNEIITDDELLNFWYGRGSFVAPDEVEIKTKSIEFIRFIFSDGKQFYLCSGGKGFYDIYTQSDKEILNRFKKDYDLMNMKVELIMEIN